MFLGKVVQLNGILLGLEGVVVGARSFRRLPEAERTEPELLLKVRGVPWASRGGDVEPHAARIQLLQLMFLVACEKQKVEFARWSYTAGCLGSTAAQTGSSRDHSEACRTRIETANRADEELEARGAKAYTTRNVHQDETKKRKVAVNEEIEMGAGVGFGTSSSSASGAAPPESSTKSVDKCLLVVVVQSAMLEKGATQRQR